MHTDLCSIGVHSDPSVAELVADSLSEHFTQERPRLF
jgi:hypothetical protein